MAEEGMSAEEAERLKRLLSLEDEDDDELDYSAPAPAPDAAPAAPVAPAPAPEPPAPALPAAWWRASPAPSVALTCDAMIEMLLLYK